MSLKSMRLPADGTLLGGEAAETPLAPQFPYGLRLDLNNESIKLLGIDPESLEVGSSVMITARAAVSAKSESEVAGKPESYSITLQITDMALGGAQADRSQAQVIYMEDS